MKIRIQQAMFYSLQAQKIKQRFSPGSRMIQNFQFYSFIQLSFLLLYKFSYMIQKQHTKSINQTKAKSELLLDALNIPLLDMEDNDFGEQLVENFQNIGFVIVKNHGISQADIDEAFGKARDVFQLSGEQKRELGFRPGFQTIRGYTGPGEQVLDQQNKGNEKKQTFDLGHPDGPNQLRFYPKNQGFIQISRKMYTKLFQAHKRIMIALEKGLKLPNNFITSKCCKDYYQQTLRYLYYPQVTVEQLQKSGKIRAGAHSDYGTVTLLFQKPGFGQNGLRALNAQKNWVRVDPPDYCMVVNLGDLFQHWTNDVLKSTIHKVEVDDEIFEKLNKGELTKVPERQTIVLFCDPDRNEMFECLPGFGQPKYPPIDGKQYVFGRLKATYGPTK